MNFNEKFPSEFPDKEEQLEKLKKTEECLRKDLKDFGLSEKKIEELIKNPNEVDQLKFIPDEFIPEVRKKIGELIDLKCRKDFLEKDGKEI